jgi:NADH-quinone oxidoreductase subunit B
MADPKWCIAMGACASTGGMHRCYGVVQGCDNFLPVDVYISGCPPRPEALIHALMDIQEKIRNEYSFAQDQAHGVPRRPVAPAAPAVLTADGDTRIAPHILYHQD